MEDRRQFFRFTTKLNCKFNSVWGIEHQHTGIVVNLSAGGARIYCVGKFPDLEEIILNISFPGNVKVEKIRARVMYHEQGNAGYFLGIMYTGIELDKLRVIINYLHQLELELKQAQERQKGPDK